jgi:hypothetical protein
MKTSFRLLAVFVVLVFVGFIRAGDLQSQVIQTTGPITIDVPGNRFLTITNFTQEGPQTTSPSRGVVLVTTTTFTAKQVLTATLVDPTTAPGSLEPINNVKIAGPATVTVMPGDTNCFITYRKGQD